MSSYPLAQAKLLTLSALLQCEVKESKEDWRETPVKREGGRFASSSGSGTGDTNPSKQPNAIREGVNRVTQSVLRGMATQASNQVQKLSTPQQEAVTELLDSRAGMFIKKEIRRLVDPAGQAAFDRVAQKMQGKGNATLGDRVKAAGRVAQKELEAAADNPIAVTKGVLGGLVLPVLVVHGLNNIDTSGSEEAAITKEFLEIGAVLGGAGLLKNSIEDINKKAQANLTKEEQQRLSEELNQFYLGVKKLEKK